MIDREINLIVIGGSWGGLQASLKIFTDLPENFPIPVILVLHRARTAESDLENIFDKRFNMHVKEAEDKEKLVSGNVYIPPPNYHVLVEKDGTISLDSSEPENYSRPSIDVTFKSAAWAFGTGTLGILLSGANKDGSLGLQTIAQHGGITIVQQPDEAENPTMPSAAIELIPECMIYTLEEIKEFLFRIK